MQSILFIALNNMKKKKGDIITLAVLSLLSSLLLYSGAACLAGVSRVMDTAHQNYNGAHLYFQAPDIIEDDIEDIILENNNIAEYEACALGIRAAIDFKVKLLKVYRDSALVIHQLKGE